MWTELGSIANGRSMPAAADAVVLVEWTKLARYALPQS